MLTVFRYRSGCISYSPNVACACSPRFASPPRFAVTSVPSSPAPIRYRIQLPGLGLSCLYFTKQLVCTKLYLLSSAHRTTRRRHPVLNFLEPTSSPSDRQSLSHSVASCQTRHSYHLYPKLSNPDVHYSLERLSCRSIFVYHATRSSTRLLHTSFYHN